MNGRGTRQQLLICAGLPVRFEVTHRGDQFRVELWRVALWQSINGVHSLPMTPIIDTVVNRESPLPQVVLDVAEGRLEAGFPKTVRSNNGCSLTSNHTD